MNNQKVVQNDRKGVHIRKLKNCHGLGPPSILDFECASKVTQGNKSVAITPLILWPIKIILDRTFLISHIDIVPAFDVCSGFS